MFNASNLEFDGHIRPACQGKQMALTGRVKGKGAWCRQIKWQADGPKSDMSMSAQSSAGWSATCQSDVAQSACREQSSMTYVEGSGDAVDFQGLV